MKKLKALMVLGVVVPLAFILSACSWFRTPTAGDTVYSLDRVYIHTAETGWTDGVAMAATEIPAIFATMSVRLNAIAVDNVIEITVGDETIEGFFYFHGTVNETNLGWLHSHVRTAPAGAGNSLLGTNPFTAFTATNMHSHAERNEIRFRVTHEGVRYEAFFTVA